MIKSRRQDVFNNKSYEKHYIKISEYVVEHDGVVDHYVTPDKCNWGFSDMHKLGSSNRCLIHNCIGAMIHRYRRHVLMPMFA